MAKRTIASTKLADEDELIFIGSASEMEQIVLQSHGGCFLRFLTQRSFDNEEKLHLVCGA